MKGLFVTLIRIFSVIYVGYDRGVEQGLIGVDSRKTREKNGSRKYFSKDFGY